MIISGPEYFLEADIILNADSVPVMGHPPANSSDLTFSDWLDGTLLTLKGTL